MRLVRFESTPRETLGHLVDDENRIVCCTIERPLGTNQKMEAIPPGTYACARWNSPRLGYEVFEITGVPGRSKILIHKGNYVENSEGCVLVGSSFADINHDGVMDEASSKAAFDDLMQHLAGVERFTLTVVNP